MWECRLEGVEAVVQRQERVSPERDDNRFLVLAQDSRARLLRPHWCIAEGLPFLPLGDGLRIDAIPLGQRPYARLTMLYRSTERLCRAGAAM